MIDGEARLCEQAPDHSFVNMLIILLTNEIMQVAPLAIFHSQAVAQLIARERVELDDLWMLIKLTQFLHDPAFVPRHLDLTRILLAGLPFCLLQNVVIVI